MWLMLTCLGAPHHLSRDNMRPSDWMRCSHLLVTVVVSHPAPSLYRLPQKLPATFLQLYANALVWGLAEMLRWKRANWQSSESPEIKSIASAIFKQ